MANKRNTTLLIEGMTCTNCALGVQKQLEKSGLTSVEVNFVNGEARFENPNGIESDLIKKNIEGLGYTVPDPKNEKKNKLGRLEIFLIVSALFTLPLFSHMFLPSGSFLHEPVWQLILATPVYLMGVSYFGTSAFRSLKVGVPNMDVLISLGSTAAFTYSLYGTIRFWGTLDAHHYLFYETAAMIITLILLGNYLEKRSVKKTTHAVKDLQGLQKSVATRFFNGQYVEVPISELALGDRILVKNGEQIPVDGKVLKGSFSTDESMLTGEGEPVFKNEGDKVYSGSIILDGSCEVEMTKNIGESALSKIIELVQNAQRDQPKIQKLGDRVSAYFVPIVVLISLLTFAVSFQILGIGFENSMLRSIAVLVISCPCAMGLATPTAVMVGIGRAAKMGILVKGGSTLEELARAKVVAFDKTGTLTNGMFRVKRLQTFKIEEVDLKSIILGLELKSNHPIAQSIVKAWYEEVTPYSFQEVQEIKGKGVHGTDEHGNDFFIGHLSEDFDLTITSNGKIIGGLDVEDDWKKGAPELIHWLNSKGIRTLLLSGDSEKKCRRLAQRIGIDEYHFRQTPSEKIRHIQMLADKGNVVMIGDGINDAPALTEASVGISMGKASDIAINSADVVLLNDTDLMQVADAFKVSRHTLLTIQQNLFWAFFYNVLAIPVAAAGFLSPAIAALSMAFSDVIVIGNSLRLRFKKL